MKHVWIRLSFFHISACVCIYIYIYAVQHIYQAMLLLFVCRLLAPLCWCQQCSILPYRCSECKETLFLVTGTTHFVIQHCTMCYCCPRSFLHEIVTWHDEHGHEGEVARNYMVNALTPFPIYTLAYTYGGYFVIQLHM